MCLMFDIHLFRRFRRSCPPIFYGVTVVVVVENVVEFISSICFNATTCFFLVFLFVGLLCENGSIFNKRLPKFNNK